MLLIVILLSTSAWCQADNSNNGSSTDKEIHEKIDYLLLDPAMLDAIKTKFANNDTTTVALVAKLNSTADKELGKGTYSVMNKLKVPPSGDKHDYMSLSIYYWPAPGKGKYEYKDGYVNPEAHRD